MKVKLLAPALFVALLTTPFLSSLGAQVTVGVAPAAGFYTGAVGFESIVGVEWEPPFLSTAVPGLAVAAGVGYSFVSQADIDTNGFAVGGGAAYTFFPLVEGLYAKPALLAGVQYSVFSGADADPQTPFLLLPSAEVGYAWPSGLRIGLYGGFKMLFYSGPGGSANERSFLLGPRGSFSFGG